jgi:hypothetical protein
MADMLQQLLQLASSPQGQQMIGQVMQSPMGQAIAQQLMGGGGGGGEGQQMDPRAMMAQMQGGGQQMPQGEGEQMPPSKAPMSTEDELAAAQEGMGGPTPEDIQMLLEDPSPMVIKSFAAKFGEEVLRKILGGKMGGGGKPQPGRDKDYEAEEDGGDDDDY